MPRLPIQRGEIWLVDLGYLGKVRPVVVVSIPFQENERALCVVVPHTTSVRNTRFELRISHPSLEPGVFDVQQTAAVQAIKFVRRLGVLSDHQLAQLNQKLAFGLGLGTTTST